MGSLDRSLLRSACASPRSAFHQPQVRSGALLLPCPMSIFPLIMSFSGFPYLPQNVTAPQVSHECSSQTVLLGHQQSASPPLLFIFLKDFPFGPKETSLLSRLLQCCISWSSSGWWRATLPCTASPQPS